MSRKRKKRFMPSDCPNNMRQFVQRVNALTDKYVPDSVDGFKPYTRIGWSKSWHNYIYDGKDWVCVGFMSKSDNMDRNSCEFNKKLKKRN